MALSRKHYEAVAAILKERMAEPVTQAGYGSVRQDEVRRVGHGLADYFASDNPHFDRERFLKACGIA